MMDCKQYFDQFKKDNIENFQLKTGIFKSPVITNCRFECLDMKFRGTRIKSSNSRPLIIPCVVRDKDGNRFKYEMMYKKDDLRQEKDYNGCHTINGYHIKTRRKFRFMYNHL